MSIFAYKSIDLMHWSKDYLRGSPFSEAAINALVEGLARDFSVTHLAVATPMNSEAEAIAEGVTPFSINPVVYAKRFTDAIHTQGLNVIFRGTDCYMEGIYDFPKWVGEDRYPLGDPSDVIDGTDRDNWLGRVWNYITENPSLFADGDLWGIYPEATGHGIFSDATSFVPHDGAGAQTNYANFFINLITVSKAAFKEIGKNVRCGFSGQNWSEINSGWLYGSVHEAQGSGRVNFSHYGTGDNDYSDTEMATNLADTYGDYSLPLFHMEWGDYWSTDPGYGYSRNEADHIAYLESMYAVWQDLIDEDKLLGFNYWRATGGAEAVYENSGDITDPADWGPNYEGETLEAFFVANTPVEDVTYEGDYATPAFVITTSANVTEGASTTAQLTAPAGKTTGDFDAGKISETSNPITSIDITQDNYTELEFVIKSTQYASAQQQYQFRITVDGTPIETYTEYPLLTVESSYSTSTNQVVANIQATSGSFENYTIGYIDKTKLYNNSVIATIQELGDTWLTGWTYRKSLLIDPSADGELTNYPKKVTVNYGSGASSGINVYLGGNCKTDFGDIRFTKEDGVTEIDYYLVQKIDSNKAVFYVEIPVINASSGALIYVYYGKNDATTTSSGTNTFTSFENFEGVTSIFDDAGLNSITIARSGTTVKEGSYSYINSTNAQAHKIMLDGGADYDIDDYRIEGWTRIISGGGTNENLGPGLVVGGTTGTNNGYQVILDQRTAVSPQIREGTDYTTRTDGNYTTALDTWYLLALYRNGTTLKAELWTETDFYTTTATSTTNRTSETTINSGKHGLYTYNTNHSIWDAVWIRKNAQNEPDYNSWGTQETQAQSITNNNLVKAWIHQKTSYLVDDFNDNIIDGIDKWTIINDGVSEVNNRLEIITTNDEVVNGVNSKYDYDFTGSSVTVRLVQYDNSGLPNDEYYAYFGVGWSTAEWDYLPEGFLFYLGENYILAGRMLHEGVDEKTTHLPFYHSKYRFFRISESGGFVTFETSINGIDWENFTTVSVSSVDIANIKILMLARQPDPVSRTTIFDSLNILETFRAQQVASKATIQVSNAKTNYTRANINSPQLSTNDVVCSIQTNFNLTLNQTKACVQITNQASQTIIGCIRVEHTASNQVVATIDIRRSYNQEVITNIEAVATSQNYAIGNIEVLHSENQSVNGWIQVGVLQSNSSKANIYTTNTTNTISKATLETSNTSLTQSIANLIGIARFNNNSIAQIEKAGTYTYYTKADIIRYNEIQSAQSLATIEVENIISQNTIAAVETTLTKSNSSKANIEIELTSDVVSRANIKVNEINSQLTLATIEVEELNHNLCVANIEIEYVNNNGVIAKILNSFNYHSIQTIATIETTNSSNNASLANLNNFQLKINSAKGNIEVRNTNNNFVIARIANAVIHENLAMAFLTSVMTYDNYVKSLIITDYQKDNTVIGAIYHPIIYKSLPYHNRRRMTYRPGGGVHAGLKTRR